MKETEELKQILKSRRKDIVKIGRLLKQIKQNKSYPKKSFSEFLRNIGLSQRTASYYIKISELENAEKLVEEIGYTKLIVLLEAKKLDEKHLNLAKKMSVYQLKQAVKEPTENQSQVEKIKDEIKKIIRKSQNIETFKKAFVEAVKEIRQ